MHVMFDHSSEETPSIRTFYFRTEKPVDYTAGQYIELTLPDDHPDERGTKRWFTLSSSPTEELLSITTRQAAEGGSSFKKKLWALESGTRVHMADPMGDFVLPKDTTRPLVFVAGGIGITPFRSMFQWLADRGERRDIAFLYAVRVEDDIIFQDEIEKAGVHATIVVGTPSEAWGGERGQLTPEMIVGLTEPSKDTLIYISGPEPMVESLQDGLKAQGVAESQLVGDFFPGYPTF